MCGSLTPERFDVVYLYSVFKSLSNMGRCPVNNEYSSSKKYRPLKWVSKTKFKIFSKKALTILITFHTIYGDTVK
jgi:hypothetical protein